MMAFRRWLIRGFFLALLLLWVAGWAVSTRYLVGVGYARGGKRLAGIVNPGVVVFTLTRGDPIADGWYGGLEPHPFRLMDSDFWWECNFYADTDVTHSSFRVVGFAYEHTSSPSAPAPSYVWHRVDVPFWFLLLVSGVTLRWAWRKSRPQPSPATAFPVETTGGQA